MTGVSQEFEYLLSTSSTGKHWKQLKIGINFIVSSSFIDI